MFTVSCLQSIHNKYSKKRFQVLKSLFSVKPVSALTYFYFKMCKIPFLQ